MIDIKSLLPEVQKLLPGISPQEIIAGIQQFAQAHPNLNNQQALQALMQYLQTQKQGGGQVAPPPQQAAPSAPPFQGLMNTLGAK
jgi:hypothetical protein